MPAPVAWGAVTLLRVRERRVQAGLREHRRDLHKTLLQSNCGRERTIPMCNRRAGLIVTSAALYERVVNNHDQQVNPPAPNQGATIGTSALHKRQAAQ